MAAKAQKGSTMASLYDLELQESNNFIILLTQNGSSPALNLMSEQVKMAESMGEAGKELVAQLEDPNSEMGKSYKKLQALEKDAKKVMEKAKMTAELAKKANTIFSKSPDSLEDLNDADRSTIKDYWTRKKMCLLLLLQMGYSHEELFS